MTPKKEELALDWYVRELLEKDRAAWRETHEGKERGFPAMVARMCKVSAAHVSNIFDGSKSAGPGFAAGYAAWKNEDWEDFRARAVAAWRTSGEPGDASLPTMKAVATAVSTPDRISWVERDGVLADLLVADLIRGGHMNPELRDAVRPRIILALGHASDGSVPPREEQLRIAFACLDEVVNGGPVERPRPRGEPIPEDSTLRAPRPATIEVKKKPRGK